MTVTAAARWAMVMSAMMLAVIVTLTLKSRAHVIVLALPATIVVMTIGLEIRIARALQRIPSEQRGNDISTLLIQLLMLIPCIGLAGLLVALD